MRKNISSIIPLIFVLGLLFVAHPVQIALAQSPITVQIDRTTIPRNEQVTLTIGVTGDFLSVANPDLSQLQDFVVVSSSSSTQVSIVNGEMSTQRVFIYRLQPVKEGMLVIDPIPVIVGSNIHKTEPIDIEVLPGGAPAAPPDADEDSPDTFSTQDFFVEAEVDNADPYLGEQIIYTFKVYQAVQFPPGQPDYQPPPFTDFWSTEILDQPHYNTETNGRDYLVTEIHTALFPANLGTITIEPAGLIIPGGILSPDIRLETEPVTVNVQPLPKDAPGDFNGAVGQFQIDARLTPTKTKVNEPVTLLVEIEGTGNVETLTEPKLPKLSGWRLFDSQATTKTDTSEGRLTGIRAFERLVVPGQPGEQVFPPINFSYFDPQTATYETVSTDPVPVTVQPDDSTQVPISIAGVDVDESQPDGRFVFDIRHIKPVPSSLSTSFNLSVIGWSFYTICWIFPALAVGGVYVWHRRQRRLQEDTAYARDQRAKHTALKILTDAQHQHTDNPSGAAGRALLGYLSDKLNMPVTGLTTNSLIQLLKETKLREDLVARVETLLHQIDVGRYAPISDESAQTILVDTGQLINDIEKSLGKRR